MIPLVYELGSLVATLLDENLCDECGSNLVFSHTTRSDEFIWLVYTKCPNGCFKDDEYNLFRIESIRG